MPILLSVLRFLHVASTVVFLGNITVTGTWKWYADQTGDAKVMAYAQRQLFWTDRVLLIPSIMVLVLSGYVSAMIQQLSIWSSPSLFAAQALFVGSGLLWNFKLRPLQLRQLGLIEAVPAGAPIPAEYSALTRAWLRAGLLAGALPIGSLALMVWR
jgi:uncharacterized membrane protein